MSISSIVCGQKKLNKIFFIGFKIPFKSTITESAINQLERGNILWFCMIIIHEEVPLSALIFCVWSHDCFFYFQDGVSIIFRDPTTISRDLFPLVYQNKSMASFIRQLQLHGFHKVDSPIASLKDQVRMEYCHRYFARGKNISSAKSSGKPHSGGK
jgi:HSF-type DNA-binding